MVIIDAWMQHPSAEFLADPMFDSLRRWAGLPTELPVWYRQNCFGDLFLSIARGSDNGSCRGVSWFRRLRWPVAGLPAGVGRALPGWVEMTAGAWGVCAGQPSGR